MVKYVGKLLSDARPTELVIGNIVRRVLYIIRHETAAVVQEEKKREQGESVDHPMDVNVDLSMSLTKLLDASSSTEGVEDPMTVESKEFVDQVRENIVEEILGLRDDLENTSSLIAKQAVEHIYAKETIMTFGLSKTVAAFLAQAGKFRKYEVIVAETAPSLEGQKQAAELIKSDIDTTVITDSAVFALMSSVNKVIIGVHAVLANGGLLAHTGAQNICMAAKQHAVPVVVVTGLHKLCPLYAFDQETFNEQNAPSQIMKFEEAGDEKVDLENPAFDYVAPEYVSLYITNVGGHNPSYIYRLLQQYYNAQDYHLE